MKVESVVGGVDRGGEGVVGVGEAVARGVHERLSIGVELVCGEGRGVGVGGEGRGQHCESADQIEDGPKAGMSVWESLWTGPEKGELGPKI